MQEVERRRKLKQRNHFDLIKGSLDILLTCREALKQKSKNFESLIGRDIKALLPKPTCRFDFAC